MLEVYKFSQCGGSLLLLNSIGRGCFEKMQFDRSLQLDTKEYLM